MKTANSGYLTRSFLLTWPRIWYHRDDCGTDSRLHAPHIEGVTSLSRWVSAIGRTIARGRGQAGTDEVIVPGGTPVVMRSGLNSLS